MTTVLVTGAGGYIGQRLVGRLAADGVAVRALVRTPVPWGLAGVDEVVGDLVVQPGLAARVAEGVDAVVHLAGANEVAAAADPESSLSDALCAAERIAASGVGRVVYLSTVHVYGDALREGAVVGEDTPAVPVHPYAAARLACEGVFERSGVSTVVLRLTNAVGAPARPEVRRWTLVVNELCREGATRGRLTLRTPGVQWRDFIALADVETVVGGLVRLGAVGIPFPSGIYNLGSGSSVTVRAVAGMIAESFAAFGDPRPELLAPPPPPDPPGPYRVDVSRLSGLGLLASGEGAGARVSVRVRPRCGRRWTRPWRSAGPTGRRCDEWVAFGALQPVSESEGNRDSDQVSVGDSDQVSVGDSDSVGDPVVRDVAEGMRRYWDDRARENAVWYVDTSVNYEAPDMERFMATGHEVVRRALLEAPVRPAGRALAVEIGCGVGRICLALSEHFDNVVCVDISESMVAQARQLVTALNVRFEVVSGADLGTVADGSADFVTTFTVFQHMPKAALIEAYVRDAGRVLRPGGVLAAQWNNLPHPRLWKLRGMWWRARATGSEGRSSWTRVWPRSSWACGCRPAACWPWWSRPASR